MDFDVCSKDPVLDERFLREMGPSDESSFEAVKRAYKGFCNRLFNNVRAEYVPQDLATRVDTVHFEDIKSFKLRSTDNVQLACGYLQNKRQSGSGGGVVVVFLHTNTSNLLQGLETLPFCASIGASLMCYDLRGCGKSDGPGLSSLEKHLGDLDRVIAWVSCSSAAGGGGGVGGPQPQIILWARGMSTATAIYHAGRSSNAPQTYPITALVLDSPYTSIQEMVNECFERLKKKGYYLPEAIFHLGVSLVRTTLTTKLEGYDPYQLCPESVVDQCFVPCVALISASDDYVPAEMGLAIVQSWLGPSSSKQFVGKHFDVRGPEVLEWAAQRVAIFLLPADPSVEGKAVLQCIYT